MKNGSGANTISTEVMSRTESVDSIRLDIYI